jgi:hypothetical protein
MMVKYLEVMYMVGASEKMMIRHTSYENLNETLHRTEFEERMCSLFPKVGKDNHDHHRQSLVEEGPRDWIGREIRSVEKREDAFG